VGSCADVAWTDLVMRRSTDGGGSWSPLEILISNSTAEEINVVGNAAPVVDRATGRIWLPYNRNNQETWITYSDDAGATWAPSTLHPELQKSGWLWVGIGPPGGLQLSSGRLLIPGYHSEFWPAPDQSSFGSGLTKGHVLLSDDHGETWRIGADDFGHLSNEASYPSSIVHSAPSSPEEEKEGGEEEEEEEEEEEGGGGGGGEGGEGAATSGLEVASALSSGRYVNECQAAELPDGTVLKQPCTQAAALCARLTPSWSCPVLV